MHLQALPVAFLLIAVSELGDKTQLLALALAAQYKAPRQVFLGAVSALSAVSLLGVMLGTAFASVLPVELIRGGAGLAFIALGLLTLGGRLAILGSPPRRGSTVFWTAFTLVGLSEIGDKTQLSTVALAARYGDPVTVLTGVVVSFMAVVSLTVLLGDRMLRRFSLRSVQRFAGALFIVFGVLFLIGF